MNRSRWGMSGVLVGAAFTILTGCTGSNKNTAIEVAAVKSVKTLTTSEEVYQISLDYQGYLTAKETKNLSFETGGKVLAVFVQQGQWVEQGDILVKLDTTSLETTVANEEIKLQSLINTYESNIRAAQMNYNRLKTAKDNNAILYETGCISKQDYDTALFSFNTAANELDLTVKKRDSDILLQEKLIMSYRKQIEDSVLTTPASGYIMSVTTKADEIITYGSPAIMLQSEEQVINIGVSVDDYQRIHTGMKVAMTANGETISGRISRIDQAPDMSAHTYTVEIVPEANDWPAGTLAEVMIPLESKRGIFIPFSAIVSSNGVNYIYILEDAEPDGYDTVIKREIAAAGNMYEDKILVENVEPGKRIVREGVKNIKENDIVVAVE